MNKEKRPTRVGRPRGRLAINSRARSRKFVVWAKKFLRQKGFSAREFAFSVGVLPNQMTEYLKGRITPSYQTLLAIKNVYPEVDMNEMFA